MKKNIRLFIYGIVPLSILACTGNVTKTDTDPIQEYKNEVAQFKADSAALLKARLDVLISFKSQFESAVFDTIKKEKKDISLDLLTIIQTRY